MLGALQMAPIPAGWLQNVSPGAAAIRSASLPGGSSGGPLTVRELEAWLLQPADTPGMPSRHLPGPGPGERAVSVLPEAGLLATDGLRSPAISLAPGATRRQLAAYLGFLALFVVGINQWRDRRHADRILVTLGFIAGLTAILALLKRVSGNGGIDWLGNLDRSGLFLGSPGAPESLAGYLAMLLPVVVGLAAATAGRMRRERNRPVRFLQQQASLLPRLVLLTGAAVFAAAGLLVSGSRMGLVSILLAAAVFLVLSPLRQRSGWKGALAGGLLAVLAVGGAAGGGGRGAPGSWWVWAEGEPSLTARLDTAGRALRMAADFPVAGVGLGAFDTGFPIYDQAHGAARRSAARSSAARLAAECGVPGMALVALALGVLLVGYLGPALVRTGSPRRHVVRGLAVAILVALLHWLLGAGLQIYSNGLLFVVLVALLVADSLARLPAPAGDVAPSVS
jgi:O-antigen ligase